MKWSQGLAVSRRCHHGNPGPREPLHVQGELFFPGEVSSVFREDAGELLSGIVQLNLAAEVGGACNHTKAGTAFYFCFLTALRHFCIQRQAK